MKKIKSKDDGSGKKINIISSTLPTHYLFNPPLPHLPSVSVAAAAAAAVAPQAFLDCLYFALVSSLFGCREIPCFHIQRQIQLELGVRKSGSCTRVGDGTVEKLDV